MDAGGGPTPSSNGWAGWARWAGSHTERSGPNV